MEKFICKKGFFLPAPPDGTGLEVKPSDEPVELELTPSQRESLIGDGSLVPTDGVGEKSEAGDDEGEANEGSESSQEGEAKE